MEYELAQHPVPKPKTIEAKSVLLKGTSLEKELDLSITVADKGEELPVEEVMTEFRKKYAE